MGYVNRNTRRPWLALDFETGPIEDAAQYVTVTAADAPKTHTKPETIAKWVAEEQAARLSKAAVDIDLARIVCTGLWASSDDGPMVLSGDTEDSEREQLETFWRAYDDIIVNQGGQLVGYNVMGFDLPLAMRRSQLLSIPYTPIDLNRYRPGAVLDLQQVLSFQGAKPFRSLGFYCKRFGIYIPDETTGADMPALIAAGDWAGVRHHNLVDLQRTVALASRLSLIGPAAGMGTDTRVVA